MSIFPDVIFNRVWDITPEFLAKHGIKGICLDIDNTLTYDCDPHLPEQSRKWLDTLSDNKIKIIILSNNRESRVEPFAKLCGLPYIFKAGKPSRKSLPHVCITLGLQPSEIALAGDQLFTDIVCANRCGYLALMCERMGRDVQPFVILKRLPEALFMPHIRKTRRYEV